MENSHTIESKAAGERRQTLGGYLASALNMEDAISNGIYLDYLNPKNWPEGIAPEVFEKIRTRLTVLIEDTKKHRRIIAALVKNYGENQ
jgi:hypothetical protein